MGVPLPRPPLHGHTSHAARRVLLAGRRCGGALAPEQQRFSDGSVGAGWSVWGDPRRPARARWGGAAHVSAVGERDVATIATWARENGRPLHVHVSEQPAENEACLAATGRTPTQLLADAGALNAMTTVVHATHVTSGDTALLARAATAVCLCPTTERELADGVGSAVDFAAAGIPLWWGQIAGRDRLFEELRAIELDERLIHRPARVARARKRCSPPAPRLERRRSAGAVRSRGRSPGRLRRDRPESVRLAGARPADAARRCVFAAGAADVTDVVVAGGGSSKAASICFCPMSRSPRACTVLSPTEGSDDEPQDRLDRTPVLRTRARG